MNAAPSGVTFEREAQKLTPVLNVVLARCLPGVVQRQRRQRVPLRPHDWYSWSQNLQVSCGRRCKPPQTEFIPPKKFWDPLGLMGVFPKSVTP